MKWQSRLPTGTKPEFVVVGGPTASGKSAVALDLAKALNGSIICCDSVQLYRGFDVGSAKPTKAEQSQVPHLLFDEFSWNENCDAAIYSLKARESIQRERASGRMPIVVGGTGLYLRALLGESFDEDIPSDESLRQELSARDSDDLFAELKALDPRRAAQLHRNDRFRVVRALEINRLTGAPVREVSVSAAAPRSHVMVFMNPAREVLHERINLRTRQMINDGLLNEVRNLLASGVDPDCKPMRSIGYKEAVAMLRGELNEGELAEAIATATRQYAKRQVTWFKKVLADSELVGTEEVVDLISQIRSLH